MPCKRLVGTDKVRSCWSIVFTFPSPSSSPCPPSLPPPLQRRNDLEKEKRKLQAEIAELQEQLAAARQRIEDLEAMKAKLEKELALMTQK